jgi:PAS domain S-box-containing protein
MVMDASTQSSQEGLNQEFAGSRALSDNPPHLVERGKAQLDIQRLADFPRFNPNPVLDLSATGEINWFNDATEAIACELGLKNIAQMLPPDKDAIVRECLASGTSKLCVETQIGPRVISWFFSPIKPTNTVHCYGSDITERRQAGEALRRSETKFRTLFDMTSDAVMVLDKKGFLDCNRATLAMFGCATREEFCSKHPAEVSPPAQPDGTGSLTLANQHIATAMGKGSHQFEWMHKRVNTGEIFPADVLLSAMELDGKRVLQATVRDIAKLKRAEEASRASREQLRALASRLQTVREEERTEVAREIHDVLAQELASLRVDVSLLTRHFAQSPDESVRSLIREKLKRMATATDAAIRSVQEIATSLRPVVLDSLGLCAAIEWQVEDFQARFGTSCKARLPAKDLGLGRDHSTALFRILQESLTNVARHAGATQVEICVECEAGYITLTVRDNGRGIQECQAKAPGALGLQGMRERALLLEGRCEISGRPGEGTRVEVQLPLPPRGNSEDKQS